MNENAPGRCPRCGWPVTAEQASIDDASGRLWHDYCAKATLDHHFKDRTAAPKRLPRKHEDRSKKE